MFKLLTGLDKVSIFSKAPATGVSGLKPGMLVAINADDEVILPPSNGYSPVYIVLSDMNEPVTKAAGTVGLAYGDMRIVTDQFETDTYAPGDALSVSTSGKLKKAGTGEYVIGHVERVITEGSDTYLVCKLF